MGVLRTKKIGSAHKKRAAELGQNPATLTGPLGWLILIVDKAISGSKTGQGDKSQLFTSFHCPSERAGRAVFYGVKASPPQFEGQSWAQRKGHFLSYEKATPLGWQSVQNGDRVSLDGGQGLRGVLAPSVLAIIQVRERVVRCVLSGNHLGDCKCVCCLCCCTSGSLRWIHQPGF